MRARLMLGVLVASLPLFASAAWLAWRTPYLWVLCACGLFALALGLAVITWAHRPLSHQVERARKLAGLTGNSSRLWALIRTDAPGDEAISSALDKIEQSLEELRALNEIGQLLACEEDLKCILSAIVGQAVALLHADAGIIGSWDPEGEVFRDVAASNLPIIFPGRSFGAGESLSSQVAKSGQAVFVDDYQNYPYRIPELDPLRLHAGLGVPLMVGSQCRGALVVHSIDPARRFTARDGELLATFARQAGTAFEKARLYQLALDQLKELTHAREQLAREGQELERALSNMVRLQEEERSRIAADVHDGVVQMMVGSLFELQAAMAYFPGEPDMVKTKQEKARSLIRDSITELRRVIFDLRPTVLDAAGLVPAVERLVEDLQQSSPAHLDVVVDGTPARLPAEVEIGAYRIVQEALNNAIKHSQARSVQVSMRFGGEDLAVTVSDDGKGFSTNEATSIDGKTAGLIGMRERARSLKGKLLLASSKERGTAVTATIPCRAIRHSAAPDLAVEAPTFEPAAGWPQPAAESKVAP